MRCSILLMILSTAVIGCTQADTPAAKPPAEDSTMGEHDHADHDHGMEMSGVKTANEYCPIMGGKVTAEGGTTEWNGKTIGFCCDGCDEKWEALSDEEKAAKLAAAQEKEHKETETAS
ncbi:MAG TPA: hypothetical protein DD473_15200 [Planctomycetaceae bacterium]|nr:hypothetical protein [Planctomycetaceae bacterium]|tara:strand:- start:313 stop:666 length:354 start_codon:yes stop_codon:yes gene_type:complete